MPSTRHFLLKAQPRHANPEDSDSGSNYGSHVDTTSAETPFVLFPLHDDVSYDDSMNDDDDTQSIRQSRSSVLTEAERDALKGPYMVQTCVLLGVATVGALLLLGINLVGVLFFKGFLRRRTPSRHSSTIYLRSLSHSRRCRYSTLLRRFSLESNSQTICDYIQSREGVSCVTSRDMDKYFHSNAEQTAFSRKRPAIPELQFLDETSFCVDRHHTDDIIASHGCYNRRSRQKGKGKIKHTRSSSIDDALWSRMTLPPDNVQPPCRTSPCGCGLLK